MHAEFQELTWVGFTWVRNCWDKSSEFGDLIRDTANLKGILKTDMWACSVTLVVSDSVWPYGPSPARLLCPWDSPGKNTGGGCHALLPGDPWPNPRLLHLPHCKQALRPLGHLGSPLDTHRVRAQSCGTLCNPTDSNPSGPSVLGFPRQKAGVGCHFPLPGSFPTSLCVPCTGRPALYLCATGNRYRDSNLPATPFIHHLH